MPYQTNNANNRKTMKKCRNGDRKKKKVTLHVLNFRTAGKSVRNVLLYKKKKRFTIEIKIVERGKPQQHVNSSTLANMTFRENNNHDG